MRPAGAPMLCMSLVNPPTAPAGADPRLATPCLPTNRIPPTAEGTLAAMTMLPGWLDAAALDALRVCHWGTMGTGGAGRVRNGITGAPGLTLTFQVQEWGAISIQLREMPCCLASSLGVRPSNTAVLNSRRDAERTE